MVEGEAEAFSHGAKAEKDFFAFDWESMDPGPADLKQVRWFSLEDHSCRFSFSGKQRFHWNEYSGRTFGRLRAFGWLDQSHVAHTVYAGMDNLTNEHFTRRQATTSFPLVYVHMQLAYSLFLKSSHLHLKWRPRELNQLADDLTNERFEQLCMSHRVEVRLPDLDLSHAGVSILSW